MISPKELRIGNYFLHDEKHIVCVLTIGLDDVEYYLSDSCQPIPLTPEILMKAGFNLAPQRISIYLKGRVKLWLGNNGVIAYLKNEDTDESYFIPNNPKYLHQLQNLYFALTGQELEVKF